MLDLAGVGSWRYRFVIFDVLFGVLRSVGSKRFGRIDVH